MKIGIDIDGVLTDYFNFIVTYGIKFCYDNGIDYNISEEKYYEGETLHISNNEVEKFWNQYLEFYCSKYSAREYSSEVIKKLKKNNEIHIITARNEEGLPEDKVGLMQIFTRNWLKDNNILYDKLEFISGSKVEYCLKNNIELIVEDSPTNIKELSKHINVLCFNAPYNKNIEGKNIERVYSWYDVLKKIEAK